MKKNEYIQPSIQVTEMMMVQTLCESPTGGSAFSPFNPEATTDEQL